MKITRDIIVNQVPKHVPEIKEPEIKESEIIEPIKGDENEQAKAKKNGKEKL